ncbi:MAG: hypothetical protein D6679_14520 [Candidatus Hydrogenedentota bacterium]|nr:MAG: hypothetical protein D6679_14520 [Candidatus Hydrogenedentota bacterium]
MEGPKSDPIVRGIWLTILVIVTGVALWVSIITGAVFLFLGVLIPIITFIIIKFIFMPLHKEKIQRALNESFGQNVVRIATAIMNYFEFPMTLLLTIALTLLFFAYSVIAVVFWLNQFR